MAAKELSIIVKAVDQATAPIRSITERLLASVGINQKKMLEMLGKVAAAAKVAALGVVGLLGVGGFAAWKAASAIMGAAETLEQIDNAATRLGMSVEDLSTLRYVAGQADVDFESLSTMIAKAQQNLAAFAYDGNGPAADAVKKLGLNVRDAAGQVRPMRELLPEIVGSLERVGDPALRIDLVRSIFGKNSEEFIQIMALGGDGIRHLADQAGRLNVVFSREQTARANALTDAVARVGEAWLGLKVKVLDIVAPFLERTMDRLSTFLSAAPQIATRLSKVFDDSPEGREVREGLGSAVMWTWQLIKDVIFGGIGTFVENLFDDLAARMNVFVADIKGSLLRVAVDAGFGDKLTQDSWNAIARSEMMTYAQKIKEARDAVDPIDNGTRWKQWSINVATSAIYAWNALDRGIGITDALRDHSIKAMEAVRALADAPLPKPPESAWTKMWAGMKTGWEEFKRQAQDVRAWADDFASSSLSNLSSAMGSAFVDSLKDIKNWEKTVRTALSNVTDAVAKTAAQMAAARIIVGAIGAFGGAAAGGGGGFAPGSQMAQMMAAQANAGGLISEHGVRRFDRGGAVPGPSVDRDVVPALLTPGERVIRRAVSQRYPGQLDALNRGASPEAAFGVPSSAGGISLAVHTTVNVNAPIAAPVDQRSLERSVVAAVIAAIDRNPAIREKLRAAVA